MDGRHCLAPLNARRVLWEIACDLRGDALADRVGIGCIVPALRPDEHFIGFIASLRAAGFGEIIVVNDGSDSSFDRVFQEAEDVLGCRVLKHAVNQGKGRALKTAFEYCINSVIGISDVITCDSDGQHLVEDIVAVADALAINRGRGVTAVVWGSRDFSKADVPWKSRFGNKTTSMLVKLVFGAYVGDTQTGLRGFPKELFERVAAIEGERFEYEMNVLLMLLKARTPIEEIPVRTVYHDLGNSQSHFRPVWDSLRVVLPLGRFAVSSVAGAAVDLLLYALLVNTLYGGKPDATKIVIAVVAARAVSSFVNFMLNRDWVFGSDAPQRIALLKYYALVGAILVGSAAGSVVLAQILHGHVIWAKIIVDTVLFTLSYVAQRSWVFSGDSATAARS